MSGLDYLNGAAALLNPELCWLLTLSLLHSLWQGAILAIVVAGLVRSRNLLTVHQRFIGVFGLLLLIAATPVANVFWLANFVKPPVSISQAKQQYQRDGQLPFFPVMELTTQATSDGELPRADEAISNDQPNRLLVLNSPTSTSLQLTQNETSAGQINWSVAGSTLATLLYALGVLIMMLRLAWALNSNWCVSRVCKRLAFTEIVPDSVAAAAEKAAQSLGRSVRIPIALFHGEGIAMVIGCIRPVVLLNTSLVSGLTPFQLEQILAHELAHIFRYDPLTQFVQRLIESVLFFHPAVWFVSRQVTDLREMCCDELVAGNYGSVGYADTLLQCVVLSQGEENANPEKPDLTTKSGFSLAAIGPRTSQLATRIESLLGRAPGGRPLKPIRQRKRLLMLTLIATLSSLAVLVCCCAIVARTPGDFAGVVIAASQQQDTPRPPKVIAIPAWKWQTIEDSEIVPGAFMFGGKQLSLAQTIPADFKIEAMVVEEYCRFAQWHFGDSRSTRVAIVIEMDGPAINRVFIDSNRDRVIEDNEQITRQTNGGKTWLTNLEVEVHENDEPILAVRQIGITLKRRRNTLRVTTLGYAEGEIKLAGKQTLVRRIDLDGNGLPNDSRDQIWIDHDRDGQFGLLAERQSLKNFVDIAGQRYAVRSDRLGQSLKLTLDNEQGKIRFVFELADKQATLETLEGSLRDESGLLIPIRPSKEPVAVPVGRYCIENLVIQARDTEGATWRITLLRGFNEGWFDVTANQQHDLKLLDSIKFRANPVHVDDQWSGHRTQLEPKMVTPNGLVVTNFTCDRPQLDRPWDNQTVQTEFKISQSGVADQEPTECTSGFN